MDLNDELITLDDLVEFDPALLSNSANEENAANIASLFEEAMMDEDMPEDMRQEISQRLSDLARRFPEQILA